LTLDLKVKFINPKFNSVLNYKLVNRVEIVYSKERVNLPLFKL
jgi:hypothetical protein